MSWPVTQTVLPILLAFIGGYLSCGAFQRWRFRRDMARLSAAYDPWAQ